MLAYRYYHGHALRLEETPAPKLLGGGALIRVNACSICGTDIRTYRFGSAKIDDGRIIGHEMTGEILELAAGLPGEFTVGDRVGVAPAIGCGECPSCARGRTNMCDSLTTMGFQYDGGFAEYTVLPKQAFRMGNVYRLPEGDPAVLALSEPLACAINAQSYLRVEQGDTIAITGGGIIGCLHAELALAAGAARVFVIETSDERIAQARALLPRATFIHGLKTDPVEELFRLTDGYGADVSIIACSVGAAQADGLNMLAKCGRISLFGGLPGESVGFLDSNLIHYRELGVFGVHASSPAHNRQAAGLIRDGGIDAAKYIAKRYPLSEIEEAFEAAASGAVMKAVIVNG